MVSNLGCSPPRRSAMTIAWFRLTKARSGPEGRSQAWSLENRASPPFAAGFAAAFLAAAFFAAGFIAPRLSPARSQTYGPLRL